MDNKKICLVGDAGVGKTCLAQRYAHNTFSYRFLSRVGVNVEKREVQLDGASVQLMIWDFQGQDEMSPTPVSFLRDAAAIVYVVDGTRTETLQRIDKLKCDTEAALGKIVPGILLFNKSDLAERWQISAEMMGRVEAGGLITLLTSCKDGSGIDTSLKLLAQVVMGKVMPWPQPEAGQYQVPIR